LFLVSPQAEGGPRSRLGSDALALFVPAPYVHVDLAAHLHLDLAPRAFDHLQLSKRFHAG